MKKNITILACAATIMALASCNKSEVISIAQPDAISFRTNVGMATKAVSKTAFATGDKLLPRSMARDNRKDRRCRCFQLCHR